ncbi:MAG: flavodoxin domain-containing protein [Erysipelotrichaceae bacterium]|nr:flavodoxin domain-containing protein [Erysipelotrichaceae bacterium]
MKLTEDIYYVGVNDHKIDLFEGQYVVPNGMAYNSYVIMDEKIAIMDTVDIHFTNEWLDKLAQVFNGRTPDYLIVQHMEPDHSANILNLLMKYPETTIVGNANTFKMIDQFFDINLDMKRMVVKNEGVLDLGTHQLSFVFAPMVHWPEVMMTYDAKDKVLFSADGFGKFGANDVEEEWDCEARRYFFGIIGKYGAQVQTLLKKIAHLDIAIIASLHGPVLTDNMEHYLHLYNIWSNYEVENEGVVIAYTSIYGHTKQAVDLLVDKLIEKGCPKVSVHDLARDDMAEAVEDAFRYDRLVLATTTYNGDVFPFMKTFIEHLIERNYQNRSVAYIENGSWAPQAMKVMKGMLEECKNISETEHHVTIRSAMKSDTKEAIEQLADELCNKKGNITNKEVPTSAKGFICKICGYVYEGDQLPSDFICPLCKHDASYFEPMK